MKTSIRTTVVSLLAAVALITSTSVAFAQETKTLKEALKDEPAISIHLLPDA